MFSQVIMPKKIYRLGQLANNIHDLRQCIYESNKFTSKATNSNIIITK